MQVLKCPQCSAPLDVSEGVQILRCKHCGTQLSMVEGANPHLAILVDQVKALSGGQAEMLQHVLELLAEKRQREFAEAMKRWSVEFERAETELREVRHKGQLLAKDVASERKSARAALILLVVAAFVMLVSSVAGGFWEGLFIASGIGGFGLLAAITYWPAYIRARRAFADVQSGFNQLAAEHEALVQAKPVLRQPHSTDAAA